jgi:MoaA/NifB/PqqE/SkfB family radical SAM enzyme
MIAPERKICWRVTRYCNLACLHCLAGHGNSFRPDLERPGRLLAAKVIGEVGLERITWTGGEPTICPDLPDLLHIMHQNGIANTITTHGLALRDEIVNAVDPASDCLRFSFDGLRDRHNFIRNAKVFDKTLREVIRMRSLGFRVEANISVMKHNLEDLPGLALLLAETGVSCIVALTLIKRESAFDNNLEALSDDEFSRLKDDLRNALHPFPDVRLRINDYTQEDDSYIILESDGDIVLSSELVPDKSYGFITDTDGAQRLQIALVDHTLRHQQVLAS